MVKKKTTRKTSTKRKTSKTNTRSEEQETIKQVQSLMKKFEKHINKTLELGVKASFSMAPQHAKKLHQTLGKVADHADRVAGHVKKLR